MKTFKVLGLLLTYPEGSIYDASDDLTGILQQEAILPNESINRIEHFISRQRAKDLLCVQEDYVQTFDKGRAHCLHLFEHIHGESRDRGQAMVDLSETYASKGLYIDSNELPDYLPLFMEYLSCCSFQEARNLLGDAIEIIAMIGAKLKKAKSPYADIFATIEVLSAIKADKTKIEKAMKASPRDPETLEELDEQWKDSEAFNKDSLQDTGSDCSDCNISSNAKPVKKLSEVYNDS